MTKKSKKKVPQLIYFELHVDSETFYVHAVIDCNPGEDIFDKVKSIRGKNFHLQLKGFLGKATEKKMHKFLRDAVPTGSLTE